MAKKVNILDRFQEKIKNSFSETKTKTSYNEHGQKVVETFNENTGEQVTKIFSHDGLDREVTKTNYIGAESVIVEKNNFYYLQNLNRDPEMFVLSCVLCHACRQPCRVRL